MQATRRESSELCLSNSYTNPFSKLMVFAFTPISPRSQPHACATPGTCGNVGPQQGNVTGTNRQRMLTTDSGCSQQTKETYNIQQKDSQRNATRQGESMMELELASKAQEPYKLSRIPEVKKTAEAHNRQQKLTTDSRSQQHTAQRLLTKCPQTREECWSWSRDQKGPL